MKNFFGLLILGATFITCMVLFLSNDSRTIYCTKCEKAWIVYNMSDEDKKYFVCPNCKMADENDTDTTGKKGSSNHYTNPIKGTLHRHMGGIGGLW